MGHSCPELWYDLRLGWKVADFTIAYHSEFFRFLRLNSWPHNLGLAPDGEFSFESDRVVCVILLQDALQAKLNHIKNLMTMKRHSGFEYETT